MAEICVRNRWKLLRNARTGWRHFWKKLIILASTQDRRLKFCMYAKDIFSVCGNVCAKIWGGQVPPGNWLVLLSYHTVVSCGYHAVSLSMQGTRVDFLSILLYTYQKLPILHSFIFFCNCVQVYNFVYRTSIFAKEIVVSCEHWHHCFTELAVLQEQYFSLEFCCTG